MSIMNESLFLSPEQVKRALMLAWRASLIARKMKLDLEIPVALVGDTGVGKTQTVRSFYEVVAEGMKNAEKPKDLKWYKIILSLLEPSDVGGFVVPNIKEGKASHLMLDSLPFDTNDWAIVFADEIDRSTPEVQNTYLQILLGKEFHGHSLSPNTFNIVALNGTSDIYTTPLSKAARTRVCSLFIGGDVKTQQESYDNWAAEKGMPEIVRVFNKVTPPTRVVHGFEELAEDTPRTRDMVAMLSLAKTSVDEKSSFQTEDIYLPMIAGLIGYETAVQWMALEKIIKEGGVMPDDIFKSPDTCSVPSEVSYISFLMYSIIGIIKKEKINKEKKARCAVIYAKRLKQEWQQIWRHQLGVNVPEVISTREYQCWKLQ